jgi:integrase
MRPRRLRVGGPCPSPVRGGHAARAAGRALCRRTSNDLPLTAATLRDPNNFGKQWRTVRQDLSVPEVTTHSFRKTVATLIDDDGLSPRIEADHLGHTHVSMTQDRYMIGEPLHACWTPARATAIRPRSSNDR